MNHLRLISTLLLVSALTGCGSSQPLATGASKVLAPGDTEATTHAACLMPPPCDAQPSNAMRNAYFGELHVHTAFSMDAVATKLKPEDAYCFATGYPVAMPPYDAAGKSLIAPYRIDRPLDFAAVTDHSEFLGETQLCTDPTLNPVVYNDPECAAYRQDKNKGYIVFNGGWAAFGPQKTPTLNPNNPLVLVDDKETHRPAYCGAYGELCRAAALAPWMDIQLQAQRFNRPGCFTSFKAYEYTLSPQSDNLHRNVIFRTAIVPAQPISTYEAPDPPALWRKLDAACTGDCEYLTIPHNSNLSNGRMFQQPGAASPNGYDAGERARKEPLIEIFQIKGDSECLNQPNASPDDPLCGFEKLKASTFFEFFLGVKSPIPPAPAETNYLRYGLKQGLLIEEDFGANPFQYGFVADTDSHMGTPGAVDEASFVGHREVPPAVGVKDAVDSNPGGITGAWAEENTRDSLFAAFKRKETFGTSGPRIKLRFFGGSAGAGGLPADLCSRGGEEFVRSGYANGTPMGTELPSATPSPRFAVWALADPFARENGRQTLVPLAKLQIVKGWVERDASGNRVTREQVYDVAQSDAAWQLNEDDCTVSGSGASQLCAVWDDPSFNPKQRAFYYSRVVEKPTCRWLTRQCLAAPRNLDCANNPPAEWAACCKQKDGSSPRAIQERAWGSPMWFKPAGP